MIAFGLLQSGAYPQQTARSATCIGLRQDAAWELLIITESRGDLSRSAMECRRPLRCRPALDNDYFGQQRQIVCKRMAKSPTTFRAIDKAYESPTGSIQPEPVISDGQFLAIQAIRWLPEIATSIAPKHRTPMRCVLLAGGLGALQSIHLL